jgi:phosphoribosyl 1,2-cyclic phosphodiesterase
VVSLLTGFGVSPGNHLLNEFDIIASGTIIIMRVLSLGSSSSGNALLIEAGPHRRTKILIDAGLPARILIDRLGQAGSHPSQLQAICITHEHSDHIIGLPSLMKHYAIPLITAPETLTAIERCTSSGMLDVDMDVSINVDLTSTGTTTYQEPWNTQNSMTPLEASVSLPAGSRYTIGDITVTSFPVSHDAASPCGYLLSAGGCRVCIVTDTGEVTPTMLDMMRHADLLVLESNHDRERLVRGPYPYILKQRILSPTGHLSNDQAADAVLHTWRADSVRWLWLAHLSRTNNTPRVALQSMLTNLEAAHANLAQIHVSVLPPGMGRVWDSTLLWQEPSLWEIQ